MGEWTHRKAVIAAVREARGEGVVELEMLESAVKDFRMIALRRASLL